MSFSYYEIYTNTQRAFSGLGFPHGADEDAAFIVSWLELHKLNGIDLFCSVIEKLNKKYDSKVNLINNEIINLEKKSTLVIGPSLIDYLVAKFIISNENQYDLINCEDPIFIIPLLSKFIKKRIYGKILSKEETLCVTNHENISINKNIFKNNVNNPIKIILSNHDDCKEILDIKINLKNTEKNLSFGLNPNKKNWDRVSDIAFQTFVPESEESRSKGAGGGDDND